MDANEMEKDMNMIEGRRRAHQRVAAAAGAAFVALLLAGSIHQSAGATAPVAAPVPEATTAVPAAPVDPSSPADPQGRGPRDHGGGFGRRGGGGGGGGGSVTPTPSSPATPSSSGGTT